MIRSYNLILIQLCCAWKLLIEHGLLGWSTLMNVHMYTPLLPQLLVGIGLDWIWLMITARRICIFVSWLIALLVGWYHTFKLKTTSLVCLGWTNTCYDWSKVVAKWGKGSNTWQGWKENGHSSSEFVGQETFIIFRSFGECAYTLVTTVKLTFVGKSVPELFTDNL